MLGVTCLTSPITLGWKSLPYQQGEEEAIKGNQSLLVGRGLRNLGDWVIARPEEFYFMGI